jgi:hypothetical protein
MSVGNFKRTAGHIGPGVDFQHGKRRSDATSFSIPSHPDYGTVGMEDAASWPALTKLPGLGIPTASAVLAAIWPSRHLFCDIRVARAAVALVNGGRWINTPLDDGYLPDQFDWDFYQWVRSAALAQTTNAVSLLLVERGLYILDSWTLDGLGDDWTENGKWSDYATEATAVLRRQAFGSSADALS